MAADSSTLAAESRASPHRNSNCTEHRLNIEPADDPLSSDGPVETEEPAPAVRTHGDESTPAMAENVAATDPVLPATTPMSTVAAPTPLSTPLSTVAAPTPLSTPLSTVAAPTPLSTPLSTVAAPTPMSTPMSTVAAPTPLSTPLSTVAAPTPLSTPMSTVAAPTPLWTPLSTVADPTTLPKCETEFRNLMAFRGMERTKENLCRVALEHWQSSAELMGKRVEKREKEIRSTRNEIYQVVGFYSAFQGLLLTAIAQSNLLHWNNRGYPLALSAFATGIAGTGVVQKNKIISDWKKTLASENPTRKALIHRVDRLMAEGINFPFQDMYEGECKNKKRPTKLDRVYSFLFNYETLVVATLITFGALCVASMLQILRHPDIPTNKDL